MNTYVSISHITYEYKNNSCLIRCKSWCNNLSKMRFDENCIFCKIPSKLNYSNSTQCKYTNSAQSLDHLVWLNVNRNVYILWNRFNWHVAMFWCRSTVTLIYLIISGISRSLQIYIGKLSCENTIVIKNRFISA